MSVWPDNGGELLGMAVITAGIYVLLDTLTVLPVVVCWVVAAAGMLWIANRP